ncbi:hypothetical protein [Dysgonomonas sp. ZJ709]|uniref:hypothetical protein n=1 Tax=Dysgonomonas sp. ZJ709 TaxID=2709797 RepID=UPI0013EA7F22|nr:hypothetical protein [Dysgonomonas sp. ZJ709]
MRLGNSFRGNTGKKYMIRGKHDKTPVKDGMVKVQRFNEWFAESYASLVCELKTKDIFNEDTLNETYLRMYESILYSGLDIDNYRSYFFRSFFTNYVQGNMKASRYCALSPNYDKPDMGGYNMEQEIQQKRLEEDIFDYVYDRYKIREFELFKMYVSLKPAINYDVLADITHLKAHQIQAIVSKIKKDVCRNHEFLQRRREVLMVC